MAIDEQLESDVDDKVKDRLARDLFNRVLSLLERVDRTPEDDAPIRRLLEKRVERPAGVVLENEVLTRNASRLRDLRTRGVSQSVLERWRSSSSFMSSGQFRR